MIRVFIAIILLLFSVGCMQKKNVETSNRKGDTKVLNQQIDVTDIVKRKILSSGKYKLIKCDPSYAGKLIANATRLCFVGIGEAEDFINFVTPDIAKLGSGNVYWLRNFGTWGASFDFNETKDEFVISINMKGDSKLLEEASFMKDYDMYIRATIYHE